MAPTAIEIKLLSTLDGVSVAIGSGPSRTHPLGQGASIQHYSDLTNALAALPSQIESYLAERRKADAA